MAVCNKLQLGVALNVILLVHASTCLFAELPRIIVEHFGDSDSLDAYFCNNSEANSFTISAISDGTKSIRTMVLTSDPEVQKVCLDRGQHRLSIFLDTTCPNGLEFLQQNKDQFNSSYHWLIWTSNLNEVVNSLESTRMDFDSKVTIITEGKPYQSEGENQETYHSMFDIYRKHKTRPPELKEYQRWSKGQPFSISPLPDRGLDGIKFTGVIMIPGWNQKNVSLALLTDPGMALGQSVRWRYGISLFLTICQHVMNCSIQAIQIPNSKELGDSQNNSTTTEALSLISRGMADFGIVPLEWEYDEEESLDFTLPIMNLKHRYVFIRPKMIGSWSALVRPLSAEIWALLAGFLVLGVIAFKAVAPYDESAQHHETWTGCVFVIISALAQQGIPDNVHKVTTRIICLGILILTYLVWIYYSTALLNGLLLPPPDNIRFTPELFGSLLDVGLEDTPYLRERISQQKSVDTTLMQKLAGTDPSEMFLPADIGMEKIVEEPYAFLADETTLNAKLWQVRMTYAEICSIGLIDDMELPRQASFVHHKNSPYKELLRKGIIRSRELGAMDRLKFDWFPSVPPCLWKQDSKQLGFEPHAIAYIIIILGGIASFVVLAGEKFNIYWQFGRSRKTIIVE
ncbi:Ligand-gated ion channel [Nesidiocoris tenuis]|uniref:Ligand-gated ion channel n=1 Tax=Nesidiocoris tenuis TaxID=355587 RepID=A0ABN7BD15_9HEMI|nr:Ligand-gated ion channel [Nesidiocoris tenuis]